MFARFKTMNMNAVTIGIILVLIFIAFLASVLTGVEKFIIFPRRKDVYTFILKYSLLGELAGLIVMFGTALTYKYLLNQRLDPDVLLVLPFYFMLAGNILGVIKANSKIK